MIFFNKKIIFKIAQTILKKNNKIGAYISWIQNLVQSYIIKIVCFHATPSIHPTLSFPNCALKSVLYVCISIADLQTRSPVLSF